MTTEEKANFLQQYQYCKERAIILLERKKAYQSNIYGLKSPDLSGMPHGTDPHGLDDKVITCSTLTAEIDHELELITRRMNYIKNLIEQVPNLKYRSMLEMRFIDGIQNKQVMQIIDRSFQATQTIRRKAIRSMNITEDTVKDYYNIK